MRWLRLSWCRLVLLLFLLLASLQLLHLVLLTRLEHRISAAPKAAPPQQTVSSKQIYNYMKTALVSNELLDTTGEYKIVRDITGRLSQTQSEPVTPGITLVTQCSINHLHHLVALAHHWTGNISVAVFAPGEHVNFAMGFIASLYSCYSELRRRFTFHMVLPLENFHTVTLKSQIFQCEEENGASHINMMMEKLKHAVKNYALEGVEYPNNLLRNVALSNSHTAYAMVIDADMLPSHNLHEDFMRIIHKQHSSKVGLLFRAKTAYVVPAFEIRSDSVIPQDKAKLLELWTKNEVRPFYHEVCWKCQRYTDYAAWRNLSSTGDLRVAYEVGWSDPWEPFYITNRNMPQYDERFRQYGFNRISQVCEMHVAGYKFAVLDQAFLLHKGFKTTEGFHHTKELEQNRNRLLFRQFKQELKSRYPDSSRRCY